MDGILPSQRLAAQHRRIDEGVQGIVDGAGRLSALTESLALLRLHLYVEEELLFPPLARSGLTMPVFVMKREHGQMWPWLQHLATACASGAAIGTLRDPARELFQLLQIHNTKEEQIVYAAVDRLASGSGDAALASALEVCEVPEGWVCAMAPR